MGAWKGSDLQTAHRSLRRCKYHRFEIRRWRSGYAVLWHPQEKHRANQRNLRCPNIARYQKLEISLHHSPTGKIAILGMSRIATKVACACLSRLAGSYDQCSIPRNTLYENTLLKATSVKSNARCLNDTPKNWA